MATVIDMRKCPACNDTYITELEELCEACTKTVTTDLMVYDLEKACNGLVQLEVNEINRHRDAISLVVEKLRTILTTTAKL